MLPNPSQLITIVISSIAFVVSIFLINVLASFYHEKNKFVNVVQMLVIVLLLHFLVFDIIVFVVMAAIKAAQAVSTKDVEEDDYHQTRKEFLQLRIRSLESQLALKQAHRDEAQNLFYYSVWTDLLVFFKYFILLTILVVGSRNTLGSYNRDVVSRAIRDYSPEVLGIDYINNIYDFYNFTETFLINGFSEAKDDEGEVLSEPGWITYELAKLLGVVRLKQIRIAGWDDTHKHDPIYETHDFLPQWSEPYTKYHYIAKYFRTYNPWTPTVENPYLYGLPKLSFGSIHDYPEDHSYVAYLARSPNNSMTVIDYLKNTSWIDEKTLAVFVDFTLFNVDSGLFTLVTIVVEETPFGDILTHVTVQSCDLVTRLDTLSYWAWLFVLLFILQLIHFAKRLVIKAWYLPNFLKSAWNIYDCLIILLNLVVFGLIFYRKSVVEDMVDSLDKISKIDYVDFRVPAQINNLMTIFIGFLIALSTIRIWKTLEFMSSFRLFTKTLSKACQALLMTTFIILVFLTGFSIATYIINGNNSVNFREVVRSITSTVNYAFGFRRDMRTDELNHGGPVVGFLLYVVLMVIVGILLIDIFISLLCDYSNRARKELLKLKGERLNKKSLGMRRFLYMEYRNAFQFCGFCKSRKKRVKLPEQTVAKDLEDAVDELSEALEKEKKEQKEREQLEEEFKPVEPVSPELLEERRRDRIERELDLEMFRREKVNNSLDVLLSQFELLGRELPLLYDEYESDESDEEETPRPRQTPRSSPKNFKEIAALSKLLLS